jgi:hypothetical protein
MGVGQEQSGADAPTFWVVVEAHYAKAFAVFGPLRDEAEWTTRVEITRGQGRDDLHCRFRVGREKNSGPTHRKRLHQ